MPTPAEIYDYLHPHNVIAAIHEAFPSVPNPGTDWYGLGNGYCFDLSPDTEYAMRSGHWNELAIPDFGAITQEIPVLPKPVLLFVLPAILCECVRKPDEDIHKPEQTLNDSNHPMLVMSAVTPVVTLSHNSKATIALERIDFDRPPGEVAAFLARQRHLDCPHPRSGWSETDYLNSLRFQEEITAHFTRHQNIAMWRCALYFCLRADDHDTYGSIINKQNACEYWYRRIDGYRLFPDESAPTNVTTS